MVSAALKAHHPIFHSNANAGEVPAGVVVSKFSFDIPNPRECVLFGDLSNNGQKIKSISFQNNGKIFNDQLRASQQLRTRQHISPRTNSALLYHNYRPTLCYLQHRRQNLLVEYGA